MDVGTHWTSCSHVRFFRVPYTSNYPPSKSLTTLRLLRPQAHTLNLFNRKSRPSSGTPADSCTMGSHQIPLSSHIHGGSGSKARSCPRGGRIRPKTTYRITTTPGAVVWPTTSNSGLSDLKSTAAQPVPIVGERYTETGANTGYSGGATEPWKDLIRLVDCIVNVSFMANRRDEEGKTRSLERSNATKDKKQVKWDTEDKVRVFMEGRALDGVTQPRMPCRMTYHEVHGTLEVCKNKCLWTYEVLLGIAIHRRRIQALGAMG